MSEQTTQLAMAETYQKALLKLTPRQQAEANTAVLRMQKGLGASTLHHLHCKPWKSFGGGQDALRIICVEQGGHLLLAHVDVHDKAYDWAERHQPRAIGRAMRIVSVVEEDAAYVSRADEQETAPPGPLASYKDKEFRHLDVNPKAASILRGVPDEDALVELLTHFEPNLAEALLTLATDCETLGDVIAVYKAAQEAGAVGGHDVDLTADINAQSVWVPPPGHAALEAALKGDLDTWKIFLHPSQRRLVKLHARGAMKVTGGPGTGKSVVALHRARHLAENIFNDDERPILLCTFSRALAVQLEEDFKALCVDKPELVDRVEVKTLTQVAQSLLKSAGKPSDLLLGQPLTEAWDEALEDEKLDFGQDFYDAERELVVLAHGCRAETEYIKANRKGRKTRLAGDSKLAVWKVIRKLEDALHARHGADAIGLAANAERLLAADDAMQPYAAVVCDEVQDTSATELRLLAALTAGGDGKTGENRLFLVGDGHQRLYRRPVSLLACGVDIRGRAHKLRLNYRTTQGICVAALKHLEGTELDEVDRDDDVQTAMDALRGYRSVRAGAPPEKQKFASASEEADWIAGLLDDDPNLLVLARRKAYLDELASLLQARGAQPLLLADNVKAPRDGLVLCSLHRSKGLEAPRVVVAGMQETPQRWPGPKAGEKDLWARKEKALLYVGLTRARDWCGLSWVKS